MATKNIADYQEEVGFYIKGAEKADNDTFIDKQILRVLRDWCRETWCWRYTLAKFNVVDETQEYSLTTIDTDGKNEICMVDWVKFKEDGNADTQFSFLKPINLETEEVPTSTGLFSAGYVNEEGDAPQFFHIAPDDGLWLYPIPNATAAGTENMQVKVVVMPDTTATKAPDFLFYDWLEPIAIGVAARICNMAAHKWYDPRLAAMYKSQYLKARNNEARAQRWEGKNRTQMHVRVNRAFSGGNRQQNWNY